MAISDPRREFASVGAGLDGLERDGLVDAPPGTGGGHRVRIARTWLRLLGYLDFERSEDVLAPELSHALDAFRHEIGLRPCRGQTRRPCDDEFRLLTALAAFDAGADEDAGGAGSPAPGVPARAVENPAWRRAIHLRLFSYGLLDAPPPGPAARARTSRRKREAQEEEISNGLERRFHAVALSLELLRAGVDRQDPAVVALLFDHAALVARLEARGSGFRFDDSLGLVGRPKRQRELNRSFLHGLATVELWLLGYSARPGRPRERGESSREVEATLFSELRAFAEDSGIAAPESREDLLGPWFFEASRAVMARGEVEARLDDAAVDGLLSEPRRRDAVAREYRSLGARLIDGVRRGLRWLWRRLRGAVRLAVSAVRNLARLGFRLASAQFARVRRLFEVAARGAAYVLSDVVPGSSWQAVRIEKGVDFDFTVLVHERAPPAEVGVFFARLRLHVRAYSIGTRLLVRLVELVRSTVRIAGGAVGWIGLVFSLIKFGNWLAAMRALSREADEVLAGFEALTSPAT